jgi:transposase InsO family protein
VALIEQARRDLHFGAVRTRIWLDRMHRVRVAAATIRRICHRLGYPPLGRKPQWRPRQLTLFSRERPGDCVQVDVKEVKVAGTKCFQDTAIDDCTRYRILRLYPQKNQWTSHTFFTTLRITLPFPIRKLQVDNGAEFSLAFALTVQQVGMRLRYIKPRCPEQNGKVERSHRVDGEKFWSRSTFAGFAPATEALLAWEHRYNHERFSLALNGLTPAEKLATFAAACSPLPSITGLQNPSRALSSTMDRLPIAAPDPTVQAMFSHNHDLNPGATS